MVADSVATPICHIFNLSLEEHICPQAWREAIVIPLPKSGNEAFPGSKSRPICLLAALIKLLEKCGLTKYNAILFKQINNRLSACL